MLVNKIAFLDIESDGIWGTPKEAGIVLFDKCNNDKSELQFDYLNDLSYFDNQIANCICDCDMVIVWHPWTKSYISQFLDKTSNAINDKFYMEFVTLHSILKNKDGHISTIAHLTERIANKQHNGKALDDARDLFDCYFKLLEK